MVLLLVQTLFLPKQKTPDSETPIEEDNWIAAMEWADSIGVDVTSTSLGYLIMILHLQVIPGRIWMEIQL